MKVTFTRRSHANMSDPRFLTEALLQERFEIQKQKRLANRVNKRIRTLKVLTIYEAHGIPVVESSENGVDLTKNAKDEVSGNPKKAINAFKDMMSKFGNSLTGMFQWLWDQIAKILGLMGIIGGHLKTLWKKIKGWMAKFHVVDRAKSLSLIAVSCVGFIAGIVGIWLSHIIYRKDTDATAVAQDAIDQTPRALDYYIHRFKDPEKYIHSTKTLGWIPKKSWDETAVFIETFGEILREDSDGGMFMAMARKAIKGGKKAVTALWKILSGSAKYLIKHNRIKRLIDLLTTSVRGSDAILANNGK